MEVDKVEEIREKLGVAVSQWQQKQSERPADYCDSVGCSPNNI